MKTKTGTPRILYISAVPPNEASFGAEMRCANVLGALQQMGAVEFVLLNDNGHETPDSQGRFEGSYALEVKELRKATVFSQLNWTLNPRADYPHGCGVGRNEVRRILRALDEFDLIWLFKLRSADLFPDTVWPRSVVDIDDLPSTYERAVLQMARGPWNRLSASRRLFAWRRRERLLGTRFSVLIACSEQDRQYLRRMGIVSPIHLVPNGFAKPSVEPVRRPSVPPRIGFIGLFEHLPNRDGMNWFANTCWPQIKSRVSDVRLRLVGRDSDEFAKSLGGADIDGLGWLENPSDEISTWSAMVVPIRVGAGTRIKIACGYSHKCPIVSTPLGAYGYGAVNGDHMFLADSADSFSAACVRAIRQPETAAQMADRAWCDFLKRWTWDAIRPAVWAAAEDCLEQAHMRFEAPILNHHGS